MDLTCPKCQGSMRTYERSGITVDQCTECRGIFLDRGELERLTDAETAWHRDSAPAVPPQAGYAAPQARPYDPSYDRDRDRNSDRDRDRGYDRDDYDRGYPKRKKHKSFLNELFD